MLFSHKLQGFFYHCHGVAQVINCMAVAHIAMMEGLHEHAAPDELGVKISALGFVFLFCILDEGDEGHRTHP